MPVVEQELPVGMLSERNLLAAIGWWGNCPKHVDLPITDWAERLPVTEVMSTPLVCLPPNAAVDDAARLMLDKKIGAVALVRDGRLRGIVTETDLLQLCTGEACWQQQKVLEHMTACVFQVPPEELIRAAWQLMREKRIRHLVVIKDDSLQGILSDRDLLAGITWGAAGPDGIRDQVRHIMTMRVATIEVEATLADAAQRMLDRKIGALSVTDHGRLTGIITETDLLKVLVREISER